MLTEKRKTRTKPTKRKKDKMPRPKKQAAKATTTKPIEEKLIDMSHADGKDEALANSLQVSQKKTLDEIWGRKFSKFKTTDSAEYYARLRKMSKLDLQKECIKQGLMPHDNRETMIERLTKECRKHLAAAQTANLQPTPIKMSDAGRRVLARGNNSLV